jgi:simple sugar transport system permease protein
MKGVLRPCLAAILGLVSGLAITWFAGENPWNVLRILGRGAFGSWYDFGMTLFYATPLILTGLSVSVALQAGLFNIGAEGQLTMGALAAAVVGGTVRGVGMPWAPMLAGLAAVAAGAAWGAIPGWLRARRGSHEVINTIMLNFIAAAIASYVTLNLLKSPETQNPETRPIFPAFVLPHFPIFNGAPVSLALPLALTAAAGLGAFFARTALGYDLKAVGMNESAARTSGIDVGNVRIAAMTMAGGLAGMVGIAEVLGNTGNFRLGFSPDYGFLGIAVALLGRNHPLGIIAAALLFGALHKGTADLDLETEHISRDLSLILQAIIILFVSAEGLWERTWRRKGAAAG